MCEHEFVNFFVLDVDSTVGSPTGFLSNHRPTSNQLEIIKCNAT